MRQKAISHLQQVRAESNALEASIKNSSNSPMTHFEVWGSLDSEIINSFTRFLQLRFLKSVCTAKVRLFCAFTFEVNSRPRKSCEMATVRQVFAEAVTTDPYSQKLHAGTCFVQVRRSYIVSLINLHLRL